MIVSSTWISSLLFISLRLSAIFIFTPIQAIRLLPITIRLSFIFGLSVLLINFIPENTSLSDVRICLGGIAEFANGLILSMSIYAAFAVFQSAGQIIESQMGMNSLAIFNPSEHYNEPLTSHLFTMLAVLFFFGLNEHLWLFKGLSYSFVIIPPGTLVLFKGILSITNMFGFMFTLAFMIASPIIISMLVIDICGAVVTRTMQQANTYFLTIPIKITLGLILLYMILNYFGPIVDTAFIRCFQTWQEMMS